jgi:DNA polymerase-3 subunit alpha
MPEQPQQEVQKSPFVHLHVHSMYSLSDALGDPAEVVERAKELGYDAVALTDHGGLYGVIEFYEAAQKAEIKPIIGVEVNVAMNRLTDKRARVDDAVYHLTLIAETNEGYQNLIKIVSQAYLEGFYYRSRTDKVALRELHAGIIALSGCLKGEIPKALASHDKDRAEQLVHEFQDIFGKENFFLELVHHPESPTQIEVNEHLVELSKKTGAPLVATKDAHYLHPDDREAQDALQCIHDGKLLSDQNRHSIATMDYSFSPQLEMEVAFGHVPEAIKNTRRIADRCSVVIELGKNHLPSFDVPGGKMPDAYLRDLCEVGIAERYPKGPSAEAKERLEFELQTIERMGFAAYFLIVQDYVNWAKQHGVIVGPGRGSAAGSIVAYSLKITNLDPLVYGLLFERFLNPDRISLPDIDMDFDDVKRKDVIEYVMDKYGREHVAGIITFGTMAARAAVRDVSRVLGWTFQEVDRIAKLIPPPVQGRHVPLAESTKENPELRSVYLNEPRTKQLIDLAVHLEGTARHASQHACGIVIAPKPLTEYAPVQKAQGGDVDRVIQYSLHSAEVTGLLKMDFLGLSNLSIIRDCLEIAEAVHGVTINIDDIPLNDKATFALFGRAETTGVFQLESDGMKRYIKDLKPTTFEDIIAMVALYRPGPMQFIESFIARKNGKEKISYAHPLLENALKNTYGIPVYQEQVMQVSKDMAGFTGGQADTLRKAMGKKIAKLMKEMRKKFIAGSVGNGVQESIAEQIFNQFEEFAAYGFNKSHAACYAMIAYQTAYLKAHFPACFMAGLLNSDCNNIDRVTIEVDECRRMGMVVLAPDVNESFPRFAVVKETVEGQGGGRWAVGGGTESDKVKPTLRFGLLAIKGLGEDMVEAVVHERKKNGAFKDIADFASRVPGKAFNKKSLEALIKSGALDRFGERNQLLFNTDALLEYHKRVEQEADSGQFNLFATASSGPNQILRLKPAPPATRRETLVWEKELLGLYVSEHPFREISGRLGSYFTPVSRLPELKKQKTVRCGGIITDAKKIFTKNNEPMVFATLEDLSGSVEVVVFPRVYNDKPDVWQADRLLCVTGRPQEKDGEMKILAESGFEITPENIGQLEALRAETSGGQAGRRAGGQGEEEGDQDTGSSVQPPVGAHGVRPAEQELQPADALEGDEVGGSDLARPPACPPARPSSDPAPITLHLRAHLPDTILHRLREACDRRPGQHPVYFLIDDERGPQTIQSSYRIAFDDAIAKELEAILGRDTVKVGRTE